MWSTIFDSNPQVGLAVNVMVMAHRREEGNDLARERRRAAGVSPPAANCVGTARLCTDGSHRWVLSTYTSMGSTSTTAA